MTCTQRESSGFSAPATATGSAPTPTPPSDYDAFVAMCDAFHRTFFGADAAGGSATAKRTVPGMQSYLLPPTFYMSEYYAARHYVICKMLQNQLCALSWTPAGTPTCRSEPTAPEDLPRFRSPQHASRPSMFACLGVFRVPLLYLAAGRLHPPT